MIFANYDSHSSPIFRQLELLKINDLVVIHTALSMQQYYSKQLPETFDNLFQPLSCKHNYKTRLASKNNYYLPKARTNFGKFNVRYYVVNIWTSLDSSEKLMNKSALKKKLSSDKIATYLCVYSNMITCLLLACLLFINRFCYLYVSSLLHTSKQSLF